MDKEIIFIVEESPEGGYQAQALGFSVYTEAESLEELKAKIKEAIECHFEENKTPHIVRLHMVKDEVMAI
ncbi:MAG TPA: 2-oxoisovalerate dehydrogenase [Candidatus Omnitrophota bacterium]|nr:2-oxoisovalerate dehydrogenase [Candidatus Omnitrophota bacterium]